MDGNFNFYGKDGEGEDRTPKEGSLPVEQEHQEEAKSVEADMGDKKENPYYQDYTGSASYGSSNGQSFHPARTQFVSANDKTNQNFGNSQGANTPTQNPYMPNSYGQPGNSQNGNPQVQNPYAQNPNVQGANAQNGNPTGQNPYMQNASGQPGNSQSGNPSAQNPYARSSNGQGAYSQPGGQFSNAGNPYAQNPYIQNAGNGNGYVQNPYMQGQNNYQPAYQPSYRPEMEEPVSILDWVGTILLAAVPCVGLIVYIVWAFSKDTKKSKANYCKASLIIMLGFLALYLIIVVVMFGTVFGALYY